MKKKIKSFLLLGCLFLIFYFSHQSGVESSQLSNSFVSWISNSFSFLSSDVLVLLVRKSAHFCEYFLLGIFVISYFSEIPKLFPHLICFSLIFCVFYAATDEFHQLFVLGRSARILDVFIDSCGSFLGILFYYFWVLRKKE